MGKSNMTDTTENVILWQVRTSSDAALRCQGALLKVKKKSGKLTLLILVWLQTQTEPMAINITLGGPLYFRGPLFMPN